MKKWALILFCIIFFSACNEHKVYDKFRETPMSGWEKNDTLKYDVPRVKVGGSYHIGLSMRIGNNFPFKSITLIVEQTIFPSHKKNTKSVKCNVIDNNGRATGRGIGIYQYDFDVTTLNLHANDSLHICIRHNMKREIIPGVSNVGIYVSR